MGLRFSNSCQWSYGGFHTFRLRLARAAGIDDLNKMIGFGGSVTWRGVKDDIVPLLRHSDCEGTMSPQVLKRVAPRLFKLIEKWPQGDFDKIRGLELARLMTECAENGRRLKFL